MGYKWAPCEVDFLIQYYPISKIKFLSKKLQRTERAVWERAYKLGLKKVAKEKKIDIMKRNLRKELETCGLIWRK